jgi:hypothetical protein
MNVDVEVYISGLVKFFKENPKDLLNLVPKDKEQDFYRMLKQYSFENYKKGDDYVLTKNQILEICVQLNDPKKRLQDAKLVKVDDLDDLKLRLDRALEDENYEEAVKIRDEIKKMS